MKEIDFLPEWYKSSKRKQFGFRAQYIALGGMFVVMVVWSLVTAYSVSEHKAELAEDRLVVAAAENITRQFNNIKTEIKELQKKAELMQKMDSKIDVTSVLAEISFLIGEKIVLNRVEFEAESLNSSQLKLTAYKAVRTAGARTPDENLLGRVRFKVALGGVAADAGEVAGLICRLEDSPYFCSVYPSFSRNVELKTNKNSAWAETVAGKKSIRLSEFEIGCYLANYRQSGNELAKQM